MSRSFLGREVAALMDPDRLLEVKAGLARLQVEWVQAPSMSPDLVFAAVEIDRRSGAIADAVTSIAVRYQSYRDRPGLLEEIGSAPDLWVFRRCRHHFPLQTPVMPPVVEGGDMDAELWGNLSNTLSLRWAHTPFHLSF
jgi:hypothetical protein